MEKMKVVLVEPRKKARVIEIDHTLEAMQKIVGGYIEQFRLDEEVSIVCNEEGKMGGFQPNRAIWYEGELIEIIFGTFFICAVDSDDFEGLTDEQAQHFAAQYMAPEYFIRTPNGISVIKDM